MCRLIYYELAKIWRKRSLALSVCVLLILNLFLLWYVNCSNGENVPLSAYKSFQNEIAEMSEIEKGDYISNLKETMDAVKSAFGFHGKYMDGSISDSVGISVCREFDF